jgi:GT2 family glycosyltransferase
MSPKTLGELYRTHTGKVSDKWSSYLPVYEEAFAPLQGRKVSLLEIGIQNGGSLEIYSQYFPSFEKLVGCDINPNCEKLKYQDPRIRVVVGDANTDKTEKRILEIVDSFDIILDDGSHTSADIIRAFARYWKHVRPGGIFIAEDLHCSYWQDYSGGLYDPFSSISFFKALADVIHQEHWGLRAGPSKRLEKFALYYGLAFDDQELQAVHAVEFFNSQCLIRKEPAEKNRLGHRILAGQDSLASPTDASLQGSAAPRYDQSANPKSIDPRQIDETHLQLFFSSTATFSEAQSVRLSYPSCGALKKVSLVLPKEAQVGRFLFLRLDPTDQAGLVLLGKIGLQGQRKKGGKMTHTFHAGDIVPTGGLFALPDSAGSYLSTGEDPAFLLAAVPTNGVAYDGLEVEIGFQQSHPTQKIQLMEIAAYIGKIQGLASSSWLKYLPISLTWPILLFKARGIKRPLWFPDNQQDLWQEKSGFWRTVEQRIRKKRKRYMAAWGFDPKWYLANNPDVVKFGIDPFLHYLNFGLLEGRKKSANHNPKRLREFLRHKNYSNWVIQYDTLEEADRLKLGSKISEMEFRPTFSIIIPIFNPRPDWLRRAIKSVKQQIYPHWQICLVDDASTNPEVLSIIKKEAAHDSRITFRLREKNGGISAASNEALGFAIGEWVAFLDHDDEIKEDALFWIAHAINQKPEAALIYSDEDKIDESGNRQCPHFKTQINLGLLLSYNYMCHLLAVRKKVLDQVGGFRSGFEGAQDYDLILRCMEKIDTSAVVHIPRILYHWRMHPQSTASSVDNKPRAEEAGRRAIAEHLHRRGTPGTVSCVPGGYRVDFEITKKPKVSIIIPTHNQGLLLKKCVESLLEITDYHNFQIILVDNKTTEPEAKALLKYYREQGLTVLSYESEFNYSRINNFAVQHAEGELILFMNNDMEIVQKDWLEVMVRQISQPDVGAVGAKLLYPNGKIQHGGVILGIGGVAGHSHKNYGDNTEGYFSRCRLVQDMSAVTGACLLIKKRFFLNINGFEENYLTVAFNDVDLCLRLKAEGKRIIWTPFACLIHHESASRGIDGPTCKRFHGEIKYMKDKWNEILDQDPAYNPNLSLDSENFMLAFPPRLAPLWRLRELIK